jgi:hypothetical protein
MGPAIAVDRFLFELRLLLVERFVLLQHRTE